MDIDITPRMIQVSRELFPGTPASVADAADLPFDHCSFDIVLLRHLLEHLPPWMMEKALAEALRVARLAVVLDFHTPLLERGERQITRTAESFLLTAGLLQKSPS